jgi:hypothetical protein
MKYSGKVLRNEESNPGSKSVKNPHAVANVNQPQGPREGNAGAHASKRGAFKAAKEERAPLADFVARAFAGRGERNRDEIDPGLEPIASNSKRQFKK